MAVLENKPYPWQAQSGISLLLVGETNINRAVPETAFANVSETLRAADILFGHMESPCAQTSPDPIGAPDIPHKPGWVFSDPSMVGAWKSVGFDAVGCASNVMYGEEPVRNTLKALDAAGIAHCGVGLDIHQAHAPAVIEKNGVKCGFLAYTSVFWPFQHAATKNRPGVATIRANTSYQPSPRIVEMPGTPPITLSACDPKELDAMRRDIQNLRRQVDIVVLSCHWGVSDMSETAAYQREIAHAAIDAGADILLGHHPHVPQGIEVYRGKPIFYSLGNFSFDWTLMRRKHLVGALARCVIDNGRLTSASFIPTLRDGETNQVSIISLHEGEGKAIANQFMLLSNVFGTVIHLEGDEMVVHLSA